MEEFASYLRWGNGFLQVNRARSLEELGDIGLSHWVVKARTSLLDYFVNQQEIESFEIIRKPEERREV